MVDINDYLLSTVVNYGLAGVVVYIFYKLISGELGELRRSIDSLRDSINTLVVEIKTRKSNSCG